MSNITMPAGVIVPRTVRPLTAAEKTRLASKVTPESLARLVTVVNTRDQRRPSIPTSFPQRPVVTTAYYTDPADNANANVTVNVSRGGGKTRLSAKAAKAKSKKG